MTEFDFVLSPRPRLLWQYFEELKKKKRKKVRWGRNRAVPWLLGQEVQEIMLKSVFHDVAESGVAGVHT